MVPTSKEKHCFTGLFCTGPPSRFLTVYLQTLILGRQSKRKKTPQCMLLGTKRKLQMELYLKIITENNKDKLYNNNSLYIWPGTTRPGKAAIQQRPSSSRFGTRRKKSFFLMPMISLAPWACSKMDILIYRFRMCTVVYSCQNLYQGISTGHQGL